MSNEFGPGHYDTTGEVADRPVPVATGRSGDRWFGPCDANGDGGTQINAMWLNLLIAEMRNATRSAGAANGELNEKKIAEAMARYASGGVFCVCSGSSNSYTLAASGNFVPPQSLFRGMTLLWRPSSINTDAATANAFETGIKPVVREDGTPLQPGDLSGRYVVTIYDPSMNEGSGAHVLLEFTRGAAGAPASGSILGLKKFVASGEYSKTPGTKKLLIFVTAPGGGGGGSTGETAGGGGAGETVIDLIDVSAVTGTIPITMGAPGAGGVNTLGSDAGLAQFGTYAKANGGKGGNKHGFFGGGESNGTGGIGGKNGGIGLLSLPGGNGHPAGPIDGGVGGASFWGGGGRAGDHNNLGPAGGAGEAPGSGGGGGDRGNGGNGANGLVLVIEFA